MSGVPLAGPLGRALRAPVAVLYGAVLAHRLFHPPRRPHHRSPADVALAHRASTVRAADGVPLDVWTIAGDGPDVAVVGHGIGLTKSASLAQARLLHDQGFTVVLFDHRNHGASGRDRSVSGLSRRFTLDVEACVAFARAQVPEPRRTLVWGFSFSSFPSVYVLRDPAVPVDAVLCDSGPAATLAPLFQGFLRAGALPVPALLRGPGTLDQVARTCARVATAMLSTAWPPPAHLGRFDRTPMLFLVGRDDPIVPVAEVAALADRFPLAQHVVVGGGHLRGLKDDPDGYRAAVLGFLAGAAAPSGRAG
ncbi:alpha/beta hydrolase [Modestobacter versicolor]|uniref:alpha/beta hydrolase n=1 Tax=Modestobacter versicolor TaxID=429133 RepID=UPI0034DE20C5